MNENYNSDIINSIKALKNDGIILYPTDTIWGIGCDATNAVAIKKIYTLKNRDEKKSVIILLAHEKDIKKYVSHPSQKIIDFISAQSNPTTAIFADAINLPRELVNADGSIAIRIVKDDFCVALLKRLGHPVISTSANVSGYDSPKNFSEIMPEIKNGVDYIVQHRQDELQMCAPSSIIKLNTFNEIEKLR
jgi:L-threonylcarbamoyladenylate synthase